MDDMKITLKYISLFGILFGFLILPQGLLGQRKSELLAQIDSLQREVRQLKTDVSEAQAKEKASLAKAESYEVLQEGQSQVVEHPLKGSGYTYEIEEVHSCLKAGETESTLWSWEDSIALHGLLEAIRDRAGIVFPGES